MRIQRLQLLFSVLVAALTLVPAVAFGQAEGVRWRNNLDAAKIEAAQSNRMVLLHFGSPNCGPCQKLEQDVFPLPQVGSAIEQHYVPVKMNADVAQALAYSFRIDRVPTDIVLTPTGKVVTKLTCPLTPDAYVAQLSNLARHYNQQASKPVAVATPLQVNSAYAGLQSQQAAPQVNTPPPLFSNAASNTATQVPSSSAVSSSNAYAANRVNFQPTPQVAQPVQTNSTPAPANTTAKPIAMPANAMPRSYRNPYTTPANAESVTLASGTRAKPQATAPSQSAIPPAAAVVAQTVSKQPAPSSIQLPAGSPPLGFEGYCPISLKFAKKWVRGDVRFGAIHRGRTYLFASDQSRQQFLADPDAYSPVFSGIDPVVLLESQQSVEGNRRFGYEYRGAFYLFSSAASMQQFASQPDQYSAQVRQAMNRLDANGGTLRK